MVEEYLTHFVNLDEEDDLDVTLDDEELEGDEKDADAEEDDDTTVAPEEDI